MHLESDPLLPAGPTRPAMSSIEIAELTGKRHDNVLRDIRNMLADAGPDLLKIEEIKIKDLTGESTSHFNLPKRECIILVSGYDVVMRARIIDRWMELEAGQSQEATPETGILASAAVLAHESASVFTSFFGVACLIGMDKPIAALSANRATQRMTGLDVLATMGTTHLVSERQERVMTATDIGVEMGGVSAIAVNRLLVEHGFQTEARDGKGKPVKEPTAIGEPFKVWVDTGKKHGDGSPVHQLKWSAGIVEALQAAIGQPQTAEAMS